MSMHDKIKRDIEQDYYVQNYANDGQRFIAWYLRNIHNLDAAEAKICLTDGAGDKQIDAVYISDDEQTVYIIQGKFYAAHSIDAEPLREVLSSWIYIKNLQVLQENANNNLKAKISEISSALDDGYEICFELITTAREVTDAAKRDMALFQDELSECLRQAYSHRLPVGDLRAQLILAAEKLRSQVLRQHRFSDALSGEWGYSAEMASVIAQSGNAGQLRSGLLEVMEHFHRECLAELGEDKLSLVLEYIDLNLDGKLNLQELAAIGCMSVPTFSKRIKERTGMTLVHYLNERRIERAKQLLKNPTATLEEIAAAAGFSNANYLTRVFKKVTGQTISDYRR